MSRKTIKIANPSLDWNQTTYLSQDCDSGATTLNVLDTNGFSTISETTDNFFVLIGRYSEEKAEIVTISAKDYWTFTCSETKFSHSSSESVTFIPYDQIRFYGMVEESGTQNLLSTIELDVTSQFTSYTYTGTEYSYFLSRYYRSISEAVESAASDIISMQTFTKYSAKNIIESAVTKAVTRIDENQNSVLSWAKCLVFLNEAMEYIKLKKRKWQFLHKTTDEGESWEPLVTAIGSPLIDDLPIDMSEIDNVKIDWEIVDYISHIWYNSMYDSTSNGKPDYWTIKNGTINLTPNSDWVYSVEIEYYKDPSIIDSLTDTIPKEFMIPATLYVWSQAAYARGNDKRGDKLSEEFNSVMNALIEEHTWPWQSGSAESVEFTSIYNIE